MEFRGVCETVAKCHLGVFSEVFVPNSQCDWPPTVTSQKALETHAIAPKMK